MVIYWLDFVEDEPNSCSIPLATSRLDGVDRSAQSDSPLTRTQSHPSGLAGPALDEDGKILLLTDFPTQFTTMDQLLTQQLHANDTHTVGQTDTKPDTPQTTAQPQSTHEKEHAPTSAASTSHLLPSLPQPWCDPDFAPLTDFFLRLSMPFPAIECLPGGALPPPWCGLLFHRTNTTPTLSKFWAGQKVHLRVIDKEEERERHILRRWIVLEVDENRHTGGHTDTPMPMPTPATDSKPAPTPVEFGSIRIRVDSLPSSLHAAVWSGQIPFATVLAQHHPPIQQTCNPTRFFKIEWTRALAAAVGIQFHDTDATHAYGRCHVMRDMQNKTICEVVEILPPFQQYATSACT